MKNEVYKAVRLPRQLADRIDRVMEMDGSNFSQFIRAAALGELKKREKQVAA